MRLPPGFDFEGLAAFTVEAWIRLSIDASNTYNFVVDHQIWTGGRRGWLLLAGLGSVGIERYSDPSTNNSISSDLPLRGIWRHVVGECDGALQRLFVDGELVREGPCAVPIPRIGIPFLVGNQNCDCTGTGFLGEIDELAIYDKALDDARVRAHVAAAR